MSSNLQESENILLIDSSISENIVEVINKKRFSKIITFDLNIHKKLLNLKVNHELSDNYLNDSDLYNIQNKSYDYSKWAETTEISKLLDHDGFNLGNFFYIEVFIFLLPFLKKFIEVKKIHEKFPNYYFYSSGMLNKICQVLEIPGSIISDSKITESFFYDSVEFNNNFLKIKLSRSNYLKLKNIFEKIINIFFQPKNIETSKNVLLIEFNTKQYSSIFHSLKSKNINPVFYGKKRPAFWDYESFSIIRKTDSSVITESFLVDKVLKEKILITNQLTLNLIQKLKNSTFLQSFFSLDEISFWPIINEYFLNLCKIRIGEGIEELEKTKKLLQKTKPKSILIISELGYTEYFVIHNAKKFEIPVILLQHGVGAFDSPESNKINEFTGSMPIQSDLFFSWGNATALYLKSFGILESKIKIIGSPAHDFTFNNVKNITTIHKDFILLTTGSSTVTDVKDYLVKTNEDYENVLRKLCQIITKHNKKIIIKVHPYVNSSVETKIAKEFEPNVSVINKGKILDLITRSELMIALSMTSAILDAQILGIPVLRLPLKEWYGSTNTHRHDPGYTVSINQFEEIFCKCLNDNNFKNSIIIDGKKFVDDCLSNQGSAADNLAKFLR